MAFMAVTRQWTKVAHCFIATTWYPMARRCTSFLDAKGPSGVWFSFRFGYPVRWHQHHVIILWDYQDITAVIAEHVTWHSWQRQDLIWSKKWHTLSHCQRHRDAVVILVLILGQVLWWVSISANLEKIMFFGDIQLHLMSIIWFRCQVSINSFDGRPPACFSFRCFMSTTRSSLYILFQQGLSLSSRYSSSCILPLLWKGLPTFFFCMDCLQQGAWLLLWIIRSNYFLHAISTLSASYTFDTLTTHLLHTLPSLWCHTTLFGHQLLLHVMYGYIALTTIINVWFWVDFSEISKQCLCHHQDIPSFYVCDCRVSFQGSLGISYQQTISFMGGSSHQTYLTTTCLELQYYQALNLKLVYAYPQPDITLYTSHHW